MNVLNFKTLDDNHAIKLGLIVLQSDITIEDEFRYYFDKTKVSILANRIPFENEVTIETLKAMEAHIKNTMQLFPIDASFDAVGYGCTSGALHIGHEAIQQIVSAERSVKAVTNPMRAAIAAMKSIKAKKIAYLSPYSKVVSQTMIDEFNNNDINVVEAATFNEPQDKIVGRISPESIVEGAMQLAKQANVDAIFISCTNMKAASVIPIIEQATGVCVISSNQALAWHLATLTGVSIDATKGKLFEC